jgi:hypothetical protein
MTRDEAYRTIQKSLRSIKNSQLYTAVQIAMKALAWECAHERMLELEEENNNEN